MSLRTCEVLVIGAGAAGLMCALTAGGRGRSVVVVDHAQKIGRKILISGGGRCNFTNLHTQAGNYLSGNPHFCKSALARYTPQHFIELVERHRIPYHEKKLGQLFCDGSAKEIVKLLLDECAQARVEVLSGVDIVSVSLEREAAFRTLTSAGEFLSGRLVIACGGLSIPTIGATDLGYRLARQFALAVVPPEPALVPLTLGGSDLAAELSGISLPARVTVAGVSFEDGLLFTHQGLSGPAVLQASSYWSPSQPLTVDLLPDHDLGQLLEDARSTASSASLATLLSAHLPRRLVGRFVDQRLGELPAHQLTPRQCAAVASSFQAWTTTPSGTEGYRKAEVTRGGIDTRELSSQTMEARRVPGLHCIGEVVDVTGWLGGYNFQWAWASGAACGNAV